jgi:DNA invertase Pin-like site-specific DNA recombinase
MWLDLWGEHPLKQQGIAFKSITENIDTSTATGQLVFHIFGALAEFERNLIKERTIAGLEAARTRGRKGGRPKLNTSEGKVAMARKLYADKSYAIEDIGKTLNISRATLYRYISGAGNLTASRAARSATTRSIGRKGVT